MAEAYLRIYLLGLPVILLFNFESAIFRSQGDSVTPLICLTASGLVNVGLNLFFVIVVGMRALGAYAVGVYPGHYRGLLAAGAAREIAENAAVLRDTGLYDENTGLALTLEEGQGLFS